MDTISGFFLNGRLKVVSSTMKTVTINEPIQYYRHEYFYEPEPVTGRLLGLVYDIPYFGASGVFPPHHIANKIFRSGGGDGGMSPGASWTPFEISEETYRVLLEQVLTTDPGTLKEESRYCDIKFIEDNTFDAIVNKMQWFQAVCQKHRARYRAERERVHSGAADAQK